MSRGISSPGEKTVVPDYARRIKALRTSILKLKQIPFAQKLSIDQTTVSKWESGKLKPSPDMFIRLAKLTSGIEKLFFLEEAGLPPAFLDGDPMTEGMVRASTEMLAESFSNETSSGQFTNDDPVRNIPLLKDARKLGGEVQTQDSELSLGLPAAWFGKNSNLQAVKFTNITSPLFSGPLIAIVDTSRKDPDRLSGCLVAVRTPTGPEPMRLQKDGPLYILVPLRQDGSIAARTVKESGNGSIMGRILKWLGDASTGRK